jgi:hypothetical protein
MRPGAVAVAGVFTGPTSLSVLSEQRDSSAFDEQLLIVLSEQRDSSAFDEQLLIDAKLAVPSKEDYKL